MPIYFKPLRRKVGVLTLVVACVFMAGWVRSTSTGDLVYLSATHSPFVLISDSSKFGFISQPQREIEFVVQNYNGQMFLWVFGEKDVAGRTFRHIRLKGHIESVRYHSPRGPEIKLTPYWPIILPLSLLSAWLLLSKPGAGNLPEKAPIE